jgi:hypothetical protein
LKQEEEKLKVQNENLIKKIEFFKSQNQKKLEKLTESKCDVDPKDEHIVVLEGKLFEKSQHLDDLKAKILKIRTQIQKIKKVYSEQLALVKQENVFYKKSIASLFEMLSLRLGEESKRSSYLEKDIQRLRSDIKYLEKFSTSTISGTIATTDRLTKSSMLKKSTHKTLRNNYQEVDESNQSLIALNKAIKLPSRVTSRNNSMRSKNQPASDAEFKRSFKPKTERSLEEDSTGFNVRSKSPIRIRGHSKQQ